jgi:PKD repeat protein
VTATDSDNLKTSVSSSVAVAPLLATAASNPATTTLGNPVVITVTPSVAGALIDHYEFDFNEGDGPVSSGSGSISHVFKQRGTNQVNIKVVPKVGSPFTIFAQVPIT